jgi:glycolate oxidase iron-sulfur subunit
MRNKKQINQLAEQQRACVGCGSCMSVCPVYQASKRENDSPRGKYRLSLALDQTITDVDPETRQLMEACLLCGRCASKCPQKVQVPQAIMAARSAHAQTLKNRILGSMLPPDPRLAGLAARLPRKSGLLLRLGGVKGLERLPLPGAESFLNMLPTELPGPPGSKRIGFFAGCVTNYLRPSLAAGALKLLTQKYTVVTPEGQSCCGLPARAAGDMTAARKLWHINQEAIKKAGVDTLITLCASCAHSLITPPPGIESEPARFEVVDISNLLEPPCPARPANQVVALHRPCHLLDDEAGFRAQKAMLQALGYKVRTIEQCCGGGGMFCVKQPEASARIFDACLQSYGTTGASTLLTSCSGCFMQWRRMLGPNHQVLHPIELAHMPALPTQ